MAKSKKPAAVNTEQTEPFDFKIKLEQDKVFLLSMIDDPYKTFQAYGLKADNQLMSMLNAVASNVRNRAAAAFTELGMSSSIENGCRACEACDKCG